MGPSDLTVSLILPELAIAAAKSKIVSILCGESCRLH